MARDAAETRKRLLEAATEEFATYGIAGARVDRVAANAGANKSLIYTYFGNKEALFDSVFEALVLSALEAVPLDPDDLPGYAAKMFDRYLAKPEILRLATWYQLERAHLEAEPKAVTEANAVKVRRIREAQRAGRISDRIPAQELIAVVGTLAMLSAIAYPGTSIDPSRAELRRRRDAVITAVTRIVSVD